MDDDSRPRRHLAKPPADKSPAGPPPPGRTRQPEAEPVYAALLRASGLQPPPGQFEAGDGLSAWPARGGAATLGSVRPAAGRPSASDLSPRLAAGPLPGDPLASRETASLDSPLTELASPHPYARSYRIQLLVPDEEPAATGFLACPVAECFPGQPDQAELARPSPPDLGHPHAAAPAAAARPAARQDHLAGARAARPTGLVSASSPTRAFSPAGETGGARLTGGTGLASGTGRTSGTGLASGTVLNGGTGETRGTGRTGAAGASGIAGAAERRGASGQASAQGRKSVGYWATAWEYAGAQARTSAGRHRRFSDRGPFWRRTLMLGGS